jgi:hypothetical protein
MKKETLIGKSFIKKNGDNKKKSKVSSHSLLYFNLFEIEVEVLIKSK